MVKQMNFILALGLHYLHSPRVQTNTCIYLVPEFFKIYCVLEDTLEDTCIYTRKTVPGNLYSFGVF